MPSGANSPPNLRLGSSLPRIGSKAHVISSNLIVEKARKLRGCLS